MYVAQEHSIYGSSRVGVDNRKDTLYKAGNYSPSWGGVGTSRRALGLKSFELANHLGNVLVTISDKPVYKVSRTTIFFNPVTSSSDYYPFGAPIQGRSAAFGGEYRFGFGGNEKDDEVKGEGNHLSFNDFGYDTRLVRRFKTDPYFFNYPSISIYASFANNPIINIDTDGKDIVYFNLAGTEMYRVKSNSEFNTFIMSNDKVGDPRISTVGWKKVDMPNIIMERNGQATITNNYQENDYVIAARTAYFNQAKNAGSLVLFTEGGNAIPKEVVQAIPDLDPTLVKAVAMQESNVGTTGITDIMQVNVPGDWVPMKAKYRLERGKQTNVTNSVYAGIRFLATKGFKGGIDYDPKTGKTTYTFQGWNKSVGSYNGSGTANYQQNVTEMVENAKTPKCSDYTEECPE
jgi:hypothetical protein